ncbi:hypothetical protein CRENBAI_006722 [Crenichthys baileyi]|uniref:Uncharacterized protein n=1 Tax=Crenichthys baileyi TaxID=28760 RepID=A0AAV9S0Z3_9TELE
MKAIALRVIKSGRSPLPFGLSASPRSRQKCLRPFSRVLASSPRHSSHRNRIPYRWTGFQSRVVVCFRSMRRKTPSREEAVSEVSEGRAAVGTYHCVVFVLAVIALSACQPAPTHSPTTSTIIIIAAASHPASQPRQPSISSPVTGLVRRQYREPLLRPGDRPLSSAAIERLVLVKTAPAGTPHDYTVCPATSPASNLAHFTPL